MSQDTSTDTEIMHKHGTLPWRPSARVLLQAATADLGRQRHNQAVSGHKAQSGPKQRVTKQKYAFLANHVRGARVESDIVEKALKGRLDGLKGGVPMDTRRLYESEATLIEALGMARKHNR